MAEEKLLPKKMIFNAIMCFIVTKGDIHRSFQVCLKPTGHLKLRKKVPIYIVDHDCDKWILLTPRFIPG